MNIEKKLAEWISSSGLGPTASLSVPADRPNEFITVERTGGSRGEFNDTAMLAVQVWAGRRSRASDLADKLARMLPRFDDHPQVSSCVVTSIYNFPEPDPPHSARYQLSVQVTAKTQP
ncbi:hypothetical protein [Bifidobacterium phasiani]|uniref:Phage protein n=1 Tax=Bifidobacterium phasiani TaxID=2834431 RepID=A0ABS6W658_9BIFI|nr:hypothetical protein [Bifidobacterium phasiani]MBW3081968.1 hypothetical protein [Bifidobacterium phasiani]